MNVRRKVRRSGAHIMMHLIVLMGSLSCVMLLAVINGTLGYLSAMGVTIFGALGVAKVIGEEIALSYNWIIALAIGCGVMRGILRYLEQYFNHYIAFKILAVLRSKIFLSLRRLCPAKLECKEKGNIISMLTADVETLEVFYAHTVSPICISIFVSVISLVFVGLTSSWYMSLAAVFAYLLIGIAVPVISSEKLKETGVKYRSEFAAFNAYFLDSIKGIKDIVLNNAGERRAEEVNARSETLLQETKIMKKTIAKSSAGTEAIVSLSILLTLAAGIFLVANGCLTLGWMIVSLVVIFNSFAPIIAVSALPGNLTQTFASGDRFLNLTEEESAVRPVEDGEVFEYENLDVKDVSFSYNEQTQVLKDIRLHAERGEIIGIWGESGCGKSTFLNLLLRFWQKDSGEISYNGIDVDRIDETSLLNNVTMVSQSTYLFDETMEDNLRIAKADATMSEIEEACRMASVHDFIMSLPDGYQTMVGSLGNNLSAGEKQRIGLARAFLKGSPLILLDEPTSNIDAINEGIILKALKTQKARKCIILVSHRKSTMSIADRIYRMENGRIVTL